MTGTEARTPRRLKVLLVVVYVAAAAALAAAALHLNALTRPGVAALAVLFMFAAEKLDFAVALGKSKVTLSWLEAIVIVSLALLPAGWAILLLAGTLVVVEATRKSKLMQGSFNAASPTAACGLV